MMDWWEKWICNSVVLMGLTFIAFTVARSLGCGGISEFIFSILRCFHCPLLDYPPVFSILISPTLGCFYQVWRGWSCRFHVQKWTVRLLLSRLSILRVLSGSYRTSTKFEAWNSSSRQPETRRDLSQHCTFRLHTADEVSWRTWLS